MAGVKPYLHIVLEPDGSTSVEGFLEKKSLCYKMLVDAIQIVGNYDPKAIVEPSEEDKRRVAKLS